jgi:hypothetical protein
MRLLKCSNPTEEIEVKDQTEAKRILWNRLCGLCKKDEYHTDEDGYSFIISEAASEDDLDSMLASACGVEWDIEE